MGPLLLGALAAGGSGLLTKLLNPAKGYKKAQEQNEKYFNQGQQYLQPYNEQGQAAYGPYSEAMQRLLNPEELQSEWGTGYEASPYAKHLMEQNRQYGLSSANAMGLGGSSAALQALQSGGANIMGQERQRYMDDLMQKYLAGAGMAQNLYGQGANTAGQMGQNSMNMGQRAGDLAYGRQNAPGEMFSDLFGKSLGFGGNYMNGPKWSTTGGGNNGYTSSR